MRFPCMCMLLGLAALHGSTARAAEARARAAVVAPAESDEAGEALVARVRAALAAEGYDVASADETTTTLRSAGALGLSCGEDAAECWVKLGTLASLDAVVRVRLPGAAGRAVLVGHDVAGMATRIVEAKLPVDDAALADAVRRALGRPAPAAAPPPSGPPDPAGAPPERVVAARPEPAPLPASATPVVVLGAGGALAAASLVGVGWAQAVFFDPAAPAALRTQAGGPWTAALVGGAALGLATAGVGGAWLWASLDDHRHPVD